LDKKTIYSKTGKGVLEIKNKAGKLSKDLVKVLTLIDGKSNMADLLAKAKFDDAEMDKAITQLAAGGYIKEFSNTSTGVSSGGSGSGGGSYVDDLDFTSSLTSSKSKNPYQSAQTEWRQRESADRVKAEVDAKKKREEEDHLKKEQASKLAREEAGRLGKVEAERKLKEAAAMKSREETERKAKIEAEAMAQTTRDLQKILEAERKALEESEKKKQEEAARRGAQEAEARSRDEAERKRREDEERQRKEAEDRKHREEEERKRKAAEEIKRREEEEERKRREQEERKRQEEEARKRKEAEELKRREEEEERKRREQEERKRQEEEARKRKEEEERKRKEEEDRRLREQEERKRQEEEARKRKEEEERKRKEEEERKRIEAEELKRREEEERKRREEEELKRDAEEDRLKREEEERRQRREEEDRRRQEEDQRRRKEDEALEEKEKEENDRRRTEEDRLRTEENERRQKEDAERRGSEAEASARRAREDDRRARDEKEESMRREDEDRRRREEEERARAPVAAKADVPAEFDLSGLKSMEDRIAVEFEKQQDELRKREEEEERRRNQDEQARLSIERAEREEEARQEAERRESEDRERRERMEQERAERDSRERKRQEEKEARGREAEERKIAAAHERQRQEEMKVESERRSREEALVGRRKEQEERDRKRAEVQSLKKSKAIRSPLEKAKPFLIGIAVVVALLFGGVQLLPMNAYIPAVEKLAADHIKEPVTIGSMKISILGGFAMNLDNVKLGTTQDVKIDRVTLSPELGSIFGDVKVVRRIDVESMSVAQEVLPRLSKWMEAALADKGVQVGRIVMKNIKIESTYLQLPPFDADLQMSPEGSIERARLSDGKLEVELTPRNNEIDIEVAANKGWVSPIGPKLEFTDFSAKAVASNSRIRVSEFKALLYGGAASGTAVLNWGGPWSIEGDLSTERINLQELMPVFTREAKSSGQLESRFRYSMVAPDLPSLFNQPKVDGSFAIRKGDLDGVDLVRALQVGGRENVQGGATRFEEITGTLALSSDRYQFRSLKLGSGLLSATGGFDVTPNNDVSGKAFVELRSQAAQIRGNFDVGGSLKAIVLKPN